MIILDICKYYKKCESNVGICIKYINEDGYNAVARNCEGDCSKCESTLFGNSGFYHSGEYIKDELKRRTKK